ncbi:hypothetical protein SAMN02745116_01034 [Pilibacter termitis]|uniref:WxL domain-containing protein n=1 Tax=Pilibacter termitis TaxID=263852 RepID=A0A1T4MBX3_9ENTE|nr:WxL domain-containing protein [Pilibacter termitis]SJZ64381.1 hypothetical protein SAMN02745116_01034 [Pilibacter termitis]
MKNKILLPISLLLTFALFFIVRTDNVEAAFEIKYSEQTESVLSNRGKVGTTEAFGGSTYDSYYLKMLMYSFDKLPTSDSSKRRADISRGSAGSTIYMNYLYKSTEPIQIELRLDEQNSRENTDNGSSSYRTTTGKYKVWRTLPNTNDVWTKIEIPIDFHDFEISAGRPYQFPFRVTAKYGGPGQIDVLRVKLTGLTSNTTSTKSTRIGVFDRTDNTMERSSNRELKFMHLGKANSNFGIEVDYEVRDKQTLNPKIPVRIVLPEHLTASQNNNVIWGNTFTFSPEALYYDQDPNMDNASQYDRERYLKSANLFKTQFEIERTLKGNQTGTKFENESWNELSYRMVPGTLKSWLYDGLGRRLETDYTVEGAGGSLTTQTMANVDVNGYAEAMRWETIAGKDGSRSSQINFSFKTNANVQLVGELTGDPIPGVEFEAFLDSDGFYSCGKFTTGADGKFSIPQDRGLQLNGLVYFEMKTSLSGYAPFPNMVSGYTTNGSTIVLKLKETSANVKINPLTDDQTSNSSLFADGSVLPGASLRAFRSSDNTATWNQIMAAKQFNTNTWQTPNVNPRFKSGEIVRVDITATPSGVSGAGTSVSTVVKDVTAPTATKLQYHLYRPDQVPTNLLYALTNIRDEFNIKDSNQNFTARWVNPIDETNLKTAVGTALDGTVLPFDVVLADEAGNERTISTELMVHNIPLTQMIPSIELQTDQMQTWNMDQLKQEIVTRANPVIKVYINGQEKIVDNKYIEFDNMDGLDPMSLDKGGSPRGSYKPTAHIKGSNIGTSMDIPLQFDVFVKNMFADILVKFEDKNGQTLEPTVRLTEQIGSTVDLSTKQAVHDAVNKIIARHYYLPVHPANETAVVVTGTGAIVTYVFEGTLQILSSPTTIDFGTSELPSTNKKIDAQSYDKVLDIWDNRHNRSSWKLTFELLQPFEDSNNKIYPWSLHYVNTSNQDITISPATGSVLLHSESNLASSNKNNWRLSDDWTNKKGFYLDVPQKSTSQTGGYQAVVEWRLVDGP